MDSAGLLLAAPMGFAGWYGALDAILQDTPQENSIKSIEQKQHN